MEKLWAHRLHFLLSSSSWKELLLILQEAFQNIIYLIFCLKRRNFRVLKAGYTVIWIKKVTNDTKYCSCLSNNRGVYEWSANLVSQKCLRCISFSTFYFKKNMESEFVYTYLWLVNIFNILPSNKIVYYFASFRQVKSMFIHMSLPVTFTIVYHLSWSVSKLSLYNVMYYVQYISE